MKKMFSNFDATNVIPKNEVQVWRSDYIKNKKDASISILFLYLSLFNSLSIPSTSF